MITFDAKDAADYLEALETALDEGRISEYRLLRKIIAEYSERILEDYPVVQFYYQRDVK